jgi:hypothetical protein
MRQSWAEIETDKTEVVLSFAPGVVDNDEGAAWSDRVRNEVVGLAEYAMVGRDGGQVVIGTHEIKSELGLWKKLRPVVNGEGWVSAS